MHSLHIFNLLFFLFISSNCYACVEFVSTDYSFVNDDRAHKTTGINMHGVIQNNCGRAVRFPVINLYVMDGGVPVNVIKHQVTYRLDPGELQEYSFQKPITGNPEDIKKQMRWDWP